LSNSPYKYKIILIQYVDNILIISDPTVDMANVSDELAKVIAQIGVTWKIDPGFCSFVN
jgi:hypothetical protein